MAGRPVALPLADGVGKLHDDFVHPRKGLREQPGPLEEAQVAAVLGEGEDHVGHLLCPDEKKNEKKKKLDEFGSINTSL